MTVLRTTLEFAPTRVYQREVYSICKQLRRFMLPVRGTGFIGYDFSCAELTLLAQLAQDSRLIDDCLSGQLWTHWLKQFPGPGTGVLTPELKTELKANIYSIVYSLTDRCITDRFRGLYTKFCQRYPVLISYLQRVQKTALSSGVSRLWDGSTLPLDVKHPKAGFMALNHPVQAGLSHLQIRLLAEYLRSGLIISLSSFDSFYFCNVDQNDNPVTETLIRSITDKVLSEIGFKFRYSVSEGKTLAEVQYGIR
jgi:hypothetical protein